MCTLYVLNNQYHDLKNDFQLHQKTINPFRVKIQCPGEYSEGDCLPILAQQVCPLYGAVRQFTFSDYEWCVRSEEGKEVRIDLKERVPFFGDGGRAI
jgi:hypothetical protein